ncbi:hypothetical protein DFA_07942 [Cavenderia fasciculata]|uniref:Uncharacterized protein n=1 Tax=Cavenderia fasciculata TaxID=261658 RepID=F4Q499_CACFS|nr:uncharacterized protein DFA_07942 [Cavenderia fasciculata]EGG16961.1 hypothetical protein DFA_07942 [Cavenderia fasciculata]|eukprot:XP_004355435.1 hypothetical protein DFA_07942 [Cavenderia fasciculata]
MIYQETETTSNRSVRPKDWESITPKWIKDLPIDRLQQLAASKLTCAVEYLIAELMIKGSETDPDETMEMVANNFLQNHENWDGNHDKHIEGLGLLQYSKEEEIDDWIKRASHPLFKSWMYRAVPKRTYNRWTIDTCIIIDYSSYKYHE